MTTGRQAAPSGVTYAEPTRPLDRLLASHPGLPFSLTLGAYPLWWLLGVTVPVFFGAAALLGIYLFRRRADLVVPKGFAYWLTFLGVVVISFLMLKADAPLAVEGGGLGGRLATTTIRMGWYATITIAFIYLVNLPEKKAPFEVIAKPLAMLFVWTVIGGVWAIMAPSVDTLSLFGQILPRGLTANPFVRDLVKIQLADQQAVLGYVEVRPKAPFAYANDWGANATLLMPFFAYIWILRGKPWQRLLSPMIVGAAIVGLVYSINRASWGALAAAGLYAVIQLVRLRPRLIPAMAVGALAATLVVIASGLGQIVVDRVNNPHSNDRRGQLAVMTVESTMRGSPILGFGNTRDVQGSFASLAGGDTPDCTGCGVPPMGTQGQLWLVLFAQGILGALFFFAFFIYRLTRHITTRDVPSSFAVATVLIMIGELPFYDLLGIPLLTAMIALALLFRRQQSLLGVQSVKSGGWVYEPVVRDPQLG